MAKILIDAIHKEETRAVLLNDGEIQEFEYESFNKKQQKGNIFLAKVIRVEPSLQAAFVEYSSENKNGFLPFAEIHSDYYQIPIEDCDAQSEADNTAHNETEVVDDVDSLATEIEEQDSVEQGSSEYSKDASVTGEEVKEKGHQYSIQEVIKVNQLIQVQVVKEERGNKGVTLTTFIALAGKYCVYMPKNSGHGGISRKITAIEVRERLREILDDFNEQGNIIIRTAGHYKSKEEIVNDYEYLVRLWKKICKTTLKATAPAFIHTEGNIVSRFIRDFVDKNVTQILVEGQETYKAAKELIKIMSPSKVDLVQLYKGRVAILTKYDVEQKINDLYSEKVNLKSGGYLVINSTEALITIDVNSGKSTSTRNIEETAYKINLEATNEIAKQVKIRNLSGLIVIDFIDMIDAEHRSQIEKSIRNACKNDKARIQLEPISKFGLLEMSRQRLYPSFIETNTTICEHCEGKGKVKSVSSTALSLLRAIERALEQRSSSYKEIHVTAAINVSLYLVNFKRDSLQAIEEKHNIRIVFNSSDKVTEDNFTIERKRNAVSKSSNQELPALLNPYEEYSNVKNVANDTKSKKTVSKRKRVKQNNNVASQKKKISIVGKLLKGLKRIVN